MARKSFVPDPGAVRCFGNRNHWWDAIGHPSRDMNATHQGFRVLERCVGCGSERINTVTLWGELLYRHYVYSDDYKKLLASINYEADIPPSQQRRKVYIKQLRKAAVA